jgi:hypothetical protein
VEEKNAEVGMRNAEKRIWKWRIMKDKDLLERTKKFALNIIKLVASLPNTREANIIPHSDFRIQIGGFKWERIPID